MSNSSLESGLRRAVDRRQRSEVWDARLGTVLVAVAVAALLAVVLGYGGVAIHVGAILVVAAPTVLLVKGLLSLREALASRRWPTVPGVVAACAHNVKEGVHIVRAAYTYAVDGESHASDRIAVGDFRTRDAASASAKAAAYSTGSEVVVHYDPECPDKAVLETGPNRTVWQPLVMGLLGLPIAWLAAEYIWGL